MRDTTIGRFQYEIDDDNAIRVWDTENPDEQGRPFFYQPDYPDGTPWESRAAAEAWIVNVIENEWLRQPDPVIDESLSTDESTEEPA